MKALGEYPHAVLLLVEDDTNAVDLFELVFRRIAPHWQLVHCGDGLEATRFMMENPMPDLIVTDLQMPKMTGQELIAWVRAQVTELRVPILALSGLSDPWLREELLELGADDYICKFSSINELKGALLRYTCRPAQGEPMANTSSDF